MKLFSQKPEDLEIIENPAYSAKMEEWCLVELGGNHHLVGWLTEHSRLGGDLPGITSPVLAMSDDSSWAITRSGSGKGRRYELSNPAPRLTISHLQMVERACRVWGVDLPEWFDRELSATRDT